MSLGMQQQLHELNQQVEQLFQAGELKQARDVAIHARDMAYQHLGENHLVTAEALNNLASLCDALGDYRAALTILEKAIEIYRATESEAHPDFIITLGNLGALYSRVGDYARSIAITEQVLQIKLHNPDGENQLSVAQTLNDLASLHVSVAELQGIAHYSLARTLYWHALEIYRTLGAESTPDFATSLSDLGRLYAAIGNYEAAKVRLDQALKIRREVLGIDHLEVAFSFHDLARLYWATGDYDAAKSLFERTLEIRRAALGAEHPLVAETLNDLSVLHAATGRETEAVVSLRQVAAIDDRVLAQVFSIGSESQRMAYLAKLWGRMATFLSLVLQLDRHVPQYVQTAFALVLRRKGIGLEALAVERDAVLSGRYPELRSAIEERRLLRMRIAQETLAGPGADGLDTHRQRLAEWEGRNEQLEADIARQIPEMDLRPRLETINVQTVAHALPEHAALIEFVRSNMLDFKAVPARGQQAWQPARYVAFVLVAGEPDSLQMINLGDAERIDAMIAAFRTSLTGSRDALDFQHVSSPRVIPDASMAYSFGDALRSAILEMSRDLQTEPNEPDGDDTANGLALRAALFDPLVSHLGGCTQLCIAPVGDLNRLPFEVLPLEDGRRLIDAYHINYLSVGRDLLRLGNRPVAHASTSLVVADPDFDLGYDDTPTGGRGTPFRPLPGTRAEGQRIASLLGETPLSRAEVLEARLKNIRSPRILHFATHGFFIDWQPQRPGNEQHTFQVTESFDKGQLRSLLNPLLRSGIALAGANTWLNHGKPPEDAENGILFAEDVTGLDLLNTELVVLSACETGLGQEVHLGEGVFGLRRAFMLAGAKTLVMSLWKVPDQQTQELMVDFYQRILAGEPRAAALRGAQLALKERYPHPRFWGAFICQGDPEPLPSVAAGAIRDEHQR